MVLLPLTDPEVAKRPKAGDCNSPIRRFKSCPLDLCPAISTEAAGFRVYFGVTHDDGYCTAYSTDNPLLRRSDRRGRNSRPARTGHSTAPLHRPGNFRATSPGHGPDLYAEGPRPAKGWNPMHDLPGGLAHLAQRQAGRRPG